MENISTTWNFLYYFHILQHASGAKFGNNMENTKLCALHVLMNWHPTDHQEMAQWISQPLKFMGVTTCLGQDKEPMG